MSINGIYNKYDSYRFGFGFIDTIQRLRAVSSPQNKVAKFISRDRSTNSMQQAMRMRKALEALEAKMGEFEKIQVASPASVISASSLDLDTTATAAAMQSTEEVNTTPTSISTFAPEWTGSTAQTTISGEYDGSNGTDTLTFKVTREGTHAENDLQIKVYDSGNNEIDKIDIKKEHAIGRQYTLDNGLVLTLSEGDLIKNDAFTVDVDETVPSSFSPSDPVWNGSTASTTIDGVYDGSHGTGTFNFVVDNGGAHGVDDLKIKVYQPDGSFLEDINIDKEDPLDTQYALSNGLTVSLGEGDLLKGTSASLDVYEAAPTDLNGMQPQWAGLGVSSAQATIDGTYDGSNGTGELTIKVDKEGTHGIDDLKIKVYQPDGSFLEDINIDKEDPLDTQYTLSNSLSLTLDEGDLLKTDTFTLDVSAAEQTAFSGYQPDWSGLDVSDAQVMLDGTYDGSNGTGTFNFVVDNGGTHGVDDLKIKVYQPDGSFLEDINIDKKDPLDTQYTLSNGIKLALGAGELFETDSFTLTFTETIGSTVDPDKPLNGTGAYNPNLENGFSVNSGSFQINGTTIDVQEDDTINTVLDRINQSDAGVTATFDVSNETVLLTQKTPGSTSDIVLENDTSGFLAAVKLGGATATPGSSSEADIPLAQVERFHAVQSGNISVNGTSISIDVNTDSLNDVLDRISASGAGVTASYNSASQKVTLNSDNANSQMTLSDGGNHFFSAVEISEGTYNSLNDLIQAEGIDVVNTPDLTAEFVKTFSTDNSDQEAQTKSVTAPDGKMMGTLVKVIASSMNALFDDSSLTSSSIAKTQGIRNNIRSAISEWSDSEGPQYGTDFGIHFDFQKTKSGVFNFSEADQRRFEIALTNPDSEAAVRNTLFGKESNGLFNHLYGALTAAISDSDSNTGATGLFLDIVV